RWIGGQTTDRIYHPPARVDSTLPSSIVPPFARGPTMFDAFVLADSPHADAVILGLTLAERARRVAVRAGARRVYVVAADTHLPNLARWDTERRAAALLVIRGGE